MESEQHTCNPDSTDLPIDESASLLGKERILARLLEQIWHGLLFIVLVGGMTSLQRFRFTGWLPIYSLHLFLMVAYVGCWLLRRKLTFNTRIMLILVLFYCVGIGGVFSFGLIGGGIWWLIMTVMLANVFYSLTTGIIHGIACLSIVAIAGIAYTSGFLSLPFDANEYILRASSWMLLIVGCVLLSLFIIAAIVTYQREVLKLLNQVEKSQKQKDKLIQEQKQALDEIKTLRSIIPICTSCKKIRDDEGFWSGVESYISKYANVQFSHGMCPDCGEKLYGNDWLESQRDKSGNNPDTNTPKE